MVHFAYVDCGLSIDEFYALSFWEWSLEVERVRQRNKKSHDKWESDAFLTRELMALIANVNRNPKRKALPFEGSDFIRLSFDKPKEENKLLTPEEVEQKFGKFKDLDFKQGKKVA